MVKKGEVVARIKSKEYEAKLEAISYQIAAKKNMYEAKKVELLIAKTTLSENVQKANSLIKSQKEQLKEVEKKIASQKALLKQDEKDLHRYKNLYSKNLIQKEVYEKVSLKVKVDALTLKALLEKEVGFKHIIAISKSNLKEAIAAKRKVKPLELELEALKNGIEAMNASKKEIEEMIDEMTLCSPVNGYIVEKIAQKGEVLSPGMVVATIIDPHSLYLKIFVDTLNNGKIKLGDRAVIFLDAKPNYPIEAKVVSVAQKAEFTPKEVSVRSDRIQRVFAVKLKPLKIDPLLKLGIPAVGVISLDGKGLPDSLKDIPEL